MVDTKSSQTIFNLVIGFVSGAGVVIIIGAAYLMFAAPKPQRVIVEQVAAIVQTAEKSRGFATPEDAATFAYKAMAENDLEGIALNCIKWKKRDDSSITSIQNIIDDYALGAVKVNYFRTREDTLFDPTAFVFTALPAVWFEGMYLSPVDAIYPNGLDSISICVMQESPDDDKWYLNPVAFMSGVYVEDDK